MFYQHSNMYNKSQGGSTQQTYSIDPRMGGEHMANCPKSYKSRSSSTSYKIMTITLSTFARAWGNFRAKIIMAAEISRPVSMTEPKGVQGTNGRTPWYFVLFAFLSWFHFTLNILIFRTVLGVVSFVSQFMPGYLQQTSSQCTKTHYDLSPSQLIHTTTTLSSKEQSKDQKESNDCCEDEVGDEMVFVEAEQEHYPPLSPLSVLRLSEVKRKVLVLDLDETLIHSYHENNILWRQQQATTPSYPYTTTGHHASGLAQLFNFFSPSSSSSSTKSTGPLGVGDIVSRVDPSCSTSGKNHSFIPFFRSSTPQGKAPPGPPDFVLKVAIDRHPVRFFVYKRPHVDHFLSVVSRWYDLVVYTASMEIYGAGVADQLDQPSPLTTSSLTPQTILGRRYYRQHCRLEPGGTFSKDLALVHPDPTSVAILDNSPAAYRRHPDNGIPVPSWFSDPEDRALLDLLPFLDALRFVSDVRSVLARNTHSLRTPSLGSVPIPVPNAGMGAGMLSNIGGGTFSRYYGNTTSAR